MNKNKAQAIAEAYIGLGQFDKGIGQLEAFAYRNPGHAWGWIKWSGQYSVFAGDDNRRDNQKAISILSRALEEPELDFRDDVLLRLEGLYQDMGMSEEAHDVRQEIAEINQKREDQLEEMSQELNELLQKVSASTAVARRKIGRNDLCPCGSGKKYKKCCGA